jgi:hypothetical protein
MPLRREVEFLRARARRLREMADAHQTGLSDHVWTAPLLQGFGNGVAVACGHVSGLYVRSVTAGLDGIRGSTPIQADGLESP